MALTTTIMRNTLHRTIGVVGGMGPGAGHELLTQIMRNTKASTDQEHLSVAMISFPRHIADRTSFLMGELVENPAIAIAEIIGRLEIVGAEVIGIACNTCHARPIFEVLVHKLQMMNSAVQLLNMPLETCRHIREHLPGCKRVAVMATNGTIQSRLYHDLMESFGFEAVIPRPEMQQHIHRMIYDPRFGIKSNCLEVPEARALIGQAIDYFRKQRADALILGCTELSLMRMPLWRSDIPFVDSTEVLAKALVREATMSMPDRSPAPLVSQVSHT
jgi:aspartate racemase